MNSNKGIIFKIKDVFSPLKNWADSSFYNPQIFFGAGAHKCIEYYCAKLASKDFCFFTSHDDDVIEPNLLIINGDVTFKNKDKLVAAYKKMVGKKFVVKIKGGLEPSYNHKNDWMDDIPVDIHIAGFPPSFESFLQGIKQLDNIK